MLKKIKDLLQIRELIDEINNKTKGYSDTIKSLSIDIDNLKTEIANISSGQKEILSKFNSDLSEMDEIKEGMRKELYDFNLLKSQLHNKILERFENALEKELNLNLERLRSEQKEYEDTKKELALVARRTSEISVLLNNIAEIGRRIKKEDFELSRYANEIWRADKEKLELMRKIDTLERLIAQIRRSGK